MRINVSEAVKNIPVAILDFYLRVLHAIVSLVQVINQVLDKSIIEVQEVILEHIENESNELKQRAQVDKYHLRTVRFRVKVRVKSDKLDPPNEIEVHFKLIAADIMNVLRGSYRTHFILQHDLESYPDVDSYNQEQVRFVYSIFSYAVENLNNLLTGLRFRLNLDSLEASKLLQKEV